MEVEMNVRYRIELSQAERDELTTVLSALQAASFTTVDASGKARDCADAPTVDAINVLRRCRHSPAHARA